MVVERRQSSDRVTIEGVERRPVNGDRGLLDTGYFACPVCMGGEQVPGGCPPSSENIVNHRVVSLPLMLDSEVSPERARWHMLVSSLVDCRQGDLTTNAPVPHTSAHRGGGASHSSLFVDVKDVMLGCRPTL